MEDKVGEPEGAGLGYGQRLNVLEDLGRARLQSVEKSSQGRVCEPPQSCGQGASDMVLPLAAPLVLLPPVSHPRVLLSPLTGHLPLRVSALRTCMRVSVESGFVNEPQCPLTI